MGTSEATVNLPVSGMTCASCTVHVAKALKATPGVKDAAVNLLLETARVTYDPAAGPDWASRFDISDNPQAESPWTVHTLSYEDEDHQRITHTEAFTHVDFAVCDSRYEKHWVPTSRSRWMETMVPVGETVQLNAIIRPPRHRSHIPATHGLRPPRRAPRSCSVSASLSRLQITRRTITSSR